MGGKVLGRRIGRIVKPYERFTYPRKILDIFRYQSLFRNVVGLTTLKKSNCNSLIQICSWYISKTLPMLVEFHVTYE